MRLCEWCKVNLAFDGELCADCTHALSPKNKIQELHAKVDAHIDECCFCTATQLCLRGKDLLIEAEYQQHFGTIDPAKWFWDNVGSYDKEV